MKNLLHLGKRVLWELMPLRLYQRQTSQDIQWKRFAKKYFFFDKFLGIRKNFQRKCLFPDELKSYGGKYTRTDCIVNCRIRSILALCDCLPFYLPYQSLNSNPPTVCTLQVRFDVDFNWFLTVQLLIAACALSAKIQK